MAMTMSETLFPLPDPTKPHLDPGLSYTRRLQLQKEYQLRNGINPGSGLPFARNGETCGSCAHLIVHWHATKYFKCEMGNPTGSEKTDIRKKWPACTAWKAKGV